MQKQSFNADQTKVICATAPVVVIVNRGTAGPGELVAAALADNKRADLVGEKTFGEGTQQKTFELPDGAALILSVAKYEAPSGKKLQDEGVTPTLLVASSQDEAPAEEEDSTTPQASAPNVRPTVSVDEQLTKALDLLKSKAA